MRLLPREATFFKTFNEQAQLILDASKLLQESMAKGPAELAKASGRLAEMERKGNELQIQVFRRLGETFITPLDPEDIHKLTSHLDNILDALEDFAMRLVSYKLNPLPAATLEFARIMRESAAHVQKAIRSLDGDRDVLDDCVAILRLEDEAVGLRRTSIAHLFEHEKDLVRLLKVKEIYDHFESAAEACARLADSIQNVVVKNA